MNFLTEQEYGDKPFVSANKNQIDSTRKRLRSISDNDLLGKKKLGNKNTNSQKDQK